MADVSGMRFELETIRKQLPQLRSASRREVVPLSPSLEVQGAWIGVAAGDRWAKSDETHHIGVPFSIPSHWREKIVAHIGLGWSSVSYPEGLAYIDGRAIQGIDEQHQDILLDGIVYPGQESEMLIEVFSGYRPGPHTLGQIELVRIDTEAEALYHDLRVLVGVVRMLPPESLERIQLLRAMEHAYRALDLRRPESDDYLQSVVEARDILRRQAFARAVGPEPEIVAAGHAHLDLAWLWPVSQTRRKGARTFSTVLRLMDRYPDYRFLASQPALYQMVKDDDPYLYERVRTRIAEGRWEPIAATWVEMDCNITGGEALVRQFLFGKRFCREAFGLDPHVLFLPDVFGYSASLPEVMKGCGVDAFITTKLSWNEYNRIPYDTFRWQGIDGTDILAHMVTAPATPGEKLPSGAPQLYTYNAMLEPDDVLLTWDAYQQKAINDRLLYLFGFGDGGGGPTAEMQEAAMRLAELPGFPRVRQGSAEKYMEELRDRVWSDPHLPSWVGELYLELHRGTYTSQGWIKRANRKAELLYREAELWSSFAASQIDGVDASSWQSDLSSGWKILLFNQFHDILPGSSINQVYVDARRDFEEIARCGEAVRGEAQAAIARSIQSDVAGIAVFNSAPFAREDPVEIRVAGRLPPSIDHSDIQPLGDDHFLLAAPAPPHGYSMYASRRPDGPQIESPPNDLRVTPSLLENRFFRVELDAQGALISLIDKRVDRQVIAAGQLGNRLIAFEDRPRSWDAWDIQINYGEKAYPVDDLTSLVVVEEGPLRAGVELVRRYQGSTIRQRILIYRDVPRIDFPTWIDWHEHQTLLKAAFPVNVHANHATHDIQWGNVERPTHWNTSWDWARFETCAHKWVDLSEGDYGVSLLNDCKYGHDIRGNVMRITLLRSPVSPDPEADQGEHVFSYSLLPHLGDWRMGETVRHSYLFNIPPSAEVIDAHPNGALPPRATLVSCDRPGLVLETVKPAEDGDGIIVRMYDAHNTRGAATVTFGAEITSAEEVNMLEEPLGAAEFAGSELRVPVRPYGISTYRVRLRLSRR